MKKISVLIPALLFLSTSFTQSCPPKIIPVISNAFIYVSYSTFNGSKFPANCMYVVTNAGVVLLDTPWDSTDFQPMLDNIEENHHSPVVLCISTHSHEDRTAGLEYFASKGIPTWSSKMTYELCVKNNEKKAENIFVSDTTFKIGEYSFETFYPGEGHTTDNIVIWIPELKILYGGCFVKSVKINDLGNLADANPTEWSVSIQKVIRKYPDARYIIPGHFDTSSKKNALKHTLKLIRKHSKN